MFLLLCALFGLVQAVWASAQCQPGYFPPDGFGRECITDVCPTPEEFIVEFTTSKGKFSVHTYRSWSPIAADRFYLLARRNFFNGNTFFRVLRNDTAHTGFVAQWGMSGNTAITAYWNAKCHELPNEDPSIIGSHSNLRGTVAFGMEYNAFKNDTCCRSTELYVNYGDNSRLDHLGFTPFGIVNEYDMITVVDHFYAGYGEVSQSFWDNMTLYGDPWLQAHYPLLDNITSTTVLAVPQDGRHRRSIILSVGLSALVLFVLVLAYLFWRQREQRKRRAEVRGAGLRATVGFDELEEEMEMEQGMGLGRTPVSVPDEEEDGGSSPDPPGMGLGSANEANAPDFSTLREDDQT